MQYLAEIQKQSKGFMGGFETKLKLLACQGGDRSWNIVPGNECIAIEDTGNLGDGALVMVNLGSNKRIQGSLEPASTRIIGILQGFSRLIEKSKSQGEEIETWKESLTIQSEQLSARELEMEARLEQLEQMEEEFNQFEQQRQEISTAREQAEKLKVELEAKSAELEQKQERLEQNLKEGKFLDESQAGEIQSLLEALSVEINSTGSIEEHLASTLGAIAKQQEILNNHWQQLEQNQGKIEAEKENYRTSQSSFSNARQELESLVGSIGEAKQHLAKEQQLLENTKSAIAFCTEQQQAQAEIQDSLARAGIESSEVELAKKIDVKALENMPLSELESTVANLEKDLKKVVQFVQDQEEELTWQSKAVEELEEKIKQASEFDCLALEHELAEEKEAKKMLDETLVGQRRSLKERHERLLQHSRILKRRQGIFDLEAELQTIDLEPIKELLKEKQQGLLKQKESLDSEVKTIEQSITSLEQSIARKTAEEATLVDSIAQQRESLEKQQQEIATIEAQLSFYRENLQSLQDGLDQIKENLETLNSSVGTNDQTKQNPSQVLTEIDRKIKELVNS